VRHQFYAAGHPATQDFLARLQVLREVVFLHLKNTLPQACWQIMRAVIPPWVCDLEALAWEEFAAGWDEETAAAGEEAATSGEEVPV